MVKYDCTVRPRSSDPYYIVTSYIKWITSYCPRSSDPFYIVTYYIKWGHCFLDRRYVDIFGYMRKISQLLYVQEVVTQFI